MQLWILKTSRSAVSQQFRYPKFANVVAQVQNFQSK